MFVKHHFVERCLNEAVAATRRNWRELRRYPFFRPITIASGNASRAAICRDVSRLGMGLLDVEPTEPGGVFAVRAPVATGHLRVDCESKWCSQIADGCFLSGVRFRDVAASVSLSLLSEVIREEVNRRVQQRFPYFRQVAIRCGGKAWQSAFCRDISREGMGLVHKWPLVPGRAIVRISDEEEEHEVSIDIRWCLPAGQGWFFSGGKYASVWLEEVPAKFL